MTREIGSLASSGASAQVLRLELPSANAPLVCFLKRTLRQKARKNLRFLSRGKYPRTNSYREMQLVFNLRRHGIPTMRVIAGGEELWFGLPVRGFILVENVPGRVLHDLFLASDAAGRLELISTFAAFIGKLHTLGFFQSVRMKDLICSDPAGRTSSEIALTLIDRVAANPGRKPFWSRFCIQTLQRGLRRMTRDGILLTPAEQRAFAEAYARSLARRWKVTGPEIEARLAL